MREYEVMLILDASLEDKDAKAAVERYLGTLTAHGGKVTNTEHWMALSLVQAHWNRVCELLGNMYSPTLRLLG
jgi:hypothetical protein